MDSGVFAEAGQLHARLLVHQLEVLLVDRIAAWWQATARATRHAAHHLPQVKPITWPRSDDLQGQRS